MKLPKMKFVIKQINIKISPINLYSILYKNSNYSFLYESLENNGENGTHSFVGGNPFFIFKAKNNNITYQDNNDIFKTKCDNPFLKLKKLIKTFNSPISFPVFSGGAVGFISYDSIRYFEQIPDNNKDETDIEDLFFIFPKEIFIFDHQQDKVYLIIYYKNDYENHINNLLNIIKNSSLNHSKAENIQISKYDSNFEKKQFYKIVEKAKEYIRKGDIFQVVLSQRFKFDFPNNQSLLLYQKLRKTNPSPYMYFLNFDNFHVLGSSPEIQIKLKEKKAIIRPIAGTRKRGKNKNQDKKLENELINDEKERAEHIMLVDLARNDIGRVCKYGSVKPIKLLEVVKYSKVMHIESTIEGILQDKYDNFDLFIATFPAGTVSGAPKIRAMEIIDELENVKRNLYAGAIGYFDFNGDMDFCIAIRTIFIKNNIGYLQAGAGIVYDSIPEFEYKETYNKARSLFNALGQEV